MLRLKMATNGAVPPTVPDEADPAVTVWRERDGAVIAYGHTVGGTAWLHLPGLAAYALGATEDDGVTAVPEASANPDLVRDAFERTVMPIALQAHGRELLHASAVRMPAGVVAFCAVAETGKSTLAYGLGQRGYPVWADDAVCFENREHSTVALPLPFGLRLRPASAGFFEQEGMSDDFAGPGPDPAPLAAIFLPERLAAGGGMARSRLAPADAFSAVLAHGYCLTTGNTERTRRMIAEYMELTDRVPAFRLAFEPGLEQLPAILDLVEGALSDLDPKNP
jgi:hypothetical protein